MSVVSLFISYRRADSEHAAQRVRERLQARFGDEGVFIDREMPPGVDWSSVLAKNVDQASAVVVMIGERFTELLQAYADKGQPDPMRAELEAALQSGKRIYPVVTGLRDMPAAAQLPPSLQPLLQANAVFAPAPYFDAAMDALIKAVESQHGWVPPRASDSPPAGAPPGALNAPTPQALADQFRLSLWGRWLSTALLTVATMAFFGHVLAWLEAASTAPGSSLPGASPAAPAWPAAVWDGARFLLATLFLGLGPFLARWLVAEMRARSWLPVNNLLGLITALNMAGMLLCGALFLLLSTIPGWRLQPLLPAWWFPPQPQAGDYVLLSLMLLGLVLAAVALAVYEPMARRRHVRGHTLSLHSLHALALLLMCGVGWFAASLLGSVAVPPGTPLVPLVGYLMLCPVLSLLFAVWEMAPTGLGTAQFQWPFRTLLAMLVALYLTVTLALWAYGPMRVFG
ncbi:MAG: toll/interleukin-1 receptor domain-containing protein [Rubrivivax sp.]|nr:toll/interleukin-1 receptor domain-containing protein [Rubrivivax sp.]